MALKKEKKRKESTMFLFFLCVFGGLVGYDEGSRWDSFWDGKKIWVAQWEFFKSSVDHIFIMWLARRILGK